MLGVIVPLAVMASSLLPGLVIFTLPESRIRLRTTLNLFGALAKLTLVGLLISVARQAGDAPDPELGRAVTNPFGEADTDFPQ